MSDNDRVGDALLDLFVYAPIGLALEAKDLVPKLADRGKGQVALTRLAAKVAADRGSNEIGTVVGQVSDAVSTMIHGDDDLASGSAPGEVAASSPADDSELPIPDYESLSAPAILGLLDDLSAQQLETLAEYEASHRQRATVLNRIGQLQR